MTGAALPRSRVFPRRLDGGSLARFLLGWAVLAGVIGLWQLAGENAGLTYLPPFTDVIGSLGQILTGPELSRDVLPSIGRAAIGFGIAAVLGIGFGLWLGIKRSLEPWIRPDYEFLRAVPPPAVLPLAIVLLGATDQMRIALIAFGCVWPVFVNSIDAARRVDPLLIETGRIASLGSRATLSRVVLPASLPQIFAGLRTSLGLALIMMVISEMVASSSGLGYLILSAQRTFQTSEMWAGVVLLGIIGWVSTVLFNVAERASIGWHQQRKESRE